MRLSVEVKCSLCNIVTLSLSDPGSLGLVTDFSECCQPAYIDIHCQLQTKLAALWHTALDNANKT